MTYKTTLWLAPGFQTSIMALATFWAPSAQIWSLYEKGRKFWESGTKGENKMASWFKESQLLLFIYIHVYIYIYAYQATYIFFKLQPSFKHFRTKATSCRPL